MRAAGDEGALLLAPGVGFEQRALPPPGGAQVHGRRLAAGDVVYVPVDVPGHEREPARVEPARRVRAQHLLRGFQRRTRG